MPRQPIDYDRLAAQHGGVVVDTAPEVDYDALAAAVSSHEPTPGAEPQAAPSWMDLAKETVSGLVQGLNPLPLLKSIYEDSVAEMQQAAEAGRRGDVVGAVTGAVKASPAGQSAKLLGSLGAAQWEQLTKGKQAYDEGRISEAVGHTVAGLLPVVGPVAGHIGEEVGSGDPRRMARAVGTGASLAAPAAVARVAPATVRVGLGSRFRNTNPAEQAAIQFGERAGIPIDAATATGNPVVRAAQYVADRSIGGAAVGHRAAQEQAIALSRTADDLAARAYPTEVSPETAGAAIRRSVEAKVSDLHNIAGDAYGRLADLEASTARPVQVGTRMRELPVTGAKIPEPIMETIGLPINLTAVRTRLKPLYERLKREAKLVPLMGDKAKALTALDRLMKGPKVVPASVADAALSDLKAMARFKGMPELRPEGKGAAAQAVQVLEDQVQRAVAQGGPEATTLRNIGRQATKEKYAVGEILDELRHEPVKAYRQATLPGDQNIAYLRQLAKIAPNELPKIGRAFLSDLFDKARAEGGFSRAQRLLGDWQKLGPETKKLLFKDAQHRADLDNFFLLAKKISENPNPSGSALVGWLPGQAALVLFNPAKGIPFVLGSAGLSKLLHSRAGVRALTEVIEVPLRSRAVAGAKVSRVAAMAGRDAIPLEAMPAMADDADR